MNFEWNNFQFDKKNIMDILESKEKSLSEDLFSSARKVCHEHYGSKVFFRGLIEFTNYCKNDCYYCGIQKSNKNIKRYRLTKEDILDCCENGYRLGFRTFVLQGGEDPYFSDNKMIDIISEIRSRFPECAITLSIGERGPDVYRAFYEAGANRYLLRHETANEKHYAMLHPSYMLSSDRKKCLYALKEIGFQVGAGFMVGSPYQSKEMLIEDLLFLKELNPQMIGIGPFIASKDTPFGFYPNGEETLTLKMVALTRLLLPKALIPATTALGTLGEDSRFKALLAGANVLMPNLSPEDLRSEYKIYDNKVSTGAESAEKIEGIVSRIKKIGLEADFGRGDAL